MWFNNPILLNEPEKAAIKFVCTFFKNEGYKNTEISGFIEPYLKSYSNKQVQRIIKKSRPSTYKRAPFFFKNRQYKTYLLFIIIDVLYRNNIRKKVSEDKLKKVSELLVSNSEEYLLLDYYFKIISEKKHITTFTSQLWNAYIFLGILPDKNNLVLKKAVSKLGKNPNNDSVKKNINIINIRNREVSDLFFYTESKSLLIISVVWLIICLSSILSLYAFFTVLLIFFIILRISVPVDGQIKYKIKSQFRIPAYSEILKAELVAHFFFDRYQVSAGKIPNYIKQYTSGINRFDSERIVKEKKSLKEITELIIDSGFSKRPFIDLLFKIAAADNFFSDAEDAYINSVADYIHYDKEKIRSIRDHYIRIGVTEKKTYRRSYSSSSSYSSSMSSYYTSKAYKILGVDKNASADEIKSAYRTLVKKYHPDKYATQGIEAMEKAEEQFQIITDAYEIIKKLRGIV